MPIERDALEIEQIINDIRLKNSQHETEFWKTGVACIVGGAILGGLVVFLMG